MTTRRNFFKKSAASALGLLLAPNIIPASVLGSNAPSNRINVGLIGCGRQSYQANAPQFLKSPNAQVIAACDVDKKRLNNMLDLIKKEYSKQKGYDYLGARAYSDYRELLQCKDIDAVMIGTPDHWHVPMAIDAARAGKHVSLEKAMSTSIAHGRRLVDAIKKYGVVSRNDSEFRTLKPIYRGIELVQNGRIGKLKKIKVGVPPEWGGNVEHDIPSMPVPKELDYDFWLGPAFEAPYTERRVHPRKGYSRPGWLRIMDYTNGMITAWGAHMMGLVQWGHQSDYTGPVAVKGTGVWDKGLWNTMSRFHVEYKYADGVEVIYEIDKPTVRFEGTEGWVEIQFPNKLTASSDKILNSVIGPDEKPIHIELSDKEDFLDAIKTGRQTLEPLELAHRANSMCQLGLIAILTGEELKWDPDIEDFIGNNAASALLDRPIREKYFKF